MRAKLKKKIIGFALLTVILAVALGVCMGYTEKIDIQLGLAYYKNFPVVINSGDSVPDGAVTASELKVHSIDVGQADCTIIEFPDDKTMIIDGADRDTAGKNAILNYITTNLSTDFKYFDYAILTHPDADHCGSFDDVLSAYPARIFYRPNVLSTYKGFTDPGESDLLGTLSSKNKKDTAVYKNIIEVAYKSTADFTPEVRVLNPENTDYDISGGEGASKYTFTFYSPLSTSYGDWNDYSPIMVLNYGSFNMVFTGDAEEKNETEFANRVGSAATDGVDDKYDTFTDEFCANIIKAGHHGSSTSSQQSYLEIMLAGDSVADTRVIVSCGEGNSYGHPHAEALARYYALGISESNVLRTDVLGTLEFSANINASGESALYYGETKIASGTVSGDTIVYQKRLIYSHYIGSTKVNFVIVGWGAYAVVLVVGVLYLAVSSKQRKR